MKHLNQTMLDNLTDIINEKNIELVEQGKKMIVNIYNLQGKYEGYFKCLTEDFNKAYNEAFFPDTAR